VEVNVVEQCLNLFKTGAVQRKRMEVREALKKQLPPGGTAKVRTEDIYPRIHGLVFNPAEGILKKLPVSFVKHIHPMDHIYGLIPKNPTAATTAATSATTNDNDNVAGGSTTH
jgi:carbonic anhydrase